MAALDFPASPSDGDTYEGYIFNAAKGVWQWQVLDPSLVSLSDTNIVTPTVDEVLKYDGTNWVNDEIVGGLVEVKSVLKTDTFSASVTAGNDVAVTGLSITHAMQNANNKLIITAYYGSAGTTSETGKVGLSVMEDTTLIAIGDADGSRVRVGAGGLVSVLGSGGTQVVAMPSITFVHLPGDTNSHTYTIRAANIESGTSTIFINRNQNDGNSTSNSRTTSGLVIQEVAV